MADTKGVPSLSSDRATQVLSPRLSRLADPGNDEEKQKLPDDLESGEDVEDDELLAKEERRKRPVPKKSSFTSGLIWMVINTLATIGIVFHLFS